MCVCCQLATVPGLLILVYKCSSCVASDTRAPLQGCAVRTGMGGSRDWAFVAWEPAYGSRAATACPAPPGLECRASACAFPLISSVCVCMLFTTVLNCPVIVEHAEVLHPVVLSPFCASASTSVLGGRRGDGGPRSFFSTHLYKDVDCVIIDFSYVFSISVTQYPFSPVLLSFFLRASCLSPSLTVSLSLALLPQF